MLRMSKKLKKVCGLVLGLALISAFAVFDVGGHSGGRWDSAQTGCGCHDLEDLSITVSIGGLPADYTPTQTYALTISVSGGPGTGRGGFNLEVTAGTLSTTDVHAKTNAAQDQATHFDEFATSWIVDWTAPIAGTGDVTFYLAGLDAGDPTNANGDSWKLYSTVVPEAVAANTPPTTDLTYPDGGEDWTGGFVKKIWWNMSDAEDTDNTQLKVWVNYSEDSGALWTPIAGAQSIAGTVNPNSYDWNVPAIDSNQMRMNVTVQDTGGLSSFDLSLADFTVDSTPPTVTATIPAHMDTGVARNTNVEVTFSEPMDQNSAQNAFELRKTDNWGLVSGVFEPWIGDTMIFNPDTDLVPGMTYQGNVSTVAKDDSDPGNNMASMYIFVFTTFDDVPPEIFNVLIDNLAVRTVAAGTIVTLNATINDIFTGNSNVSGANYTIGAINWASSVNMNPQDPAFDSPFEVATIAIDTTTWADGVYDLYVYAWDEGPNYNTTSTSFATLVISSDFEAPIVSNAMINGAPAQTYPLSSIPTLTLTATINDTTTGNSNIDGANYTDGDKNWPGTDMTPVVPPFNSPTEEVTIDIAPLPTAPGTYYYYVYGWDDKLNYNTTSTAFATLTIVDDLPPEVFNVQVDGQPSVTVQPGTVVNLTATLDDTNTGGSIIAGANNTTGPANWATSAPMTPLTPLDSPTEDFIQAIDTTGWPLGTYDLYVYGWDVAFNDNTTSQAYATIIISADIEPPEITNVLIDGQPTTTVYLSAYLPAVNLTATIDDTGTGGSNIGGANYTTPTMTSFPGTDMNAVPPPFDSPVENVTATIATPNLPGTYRYYVYAWDEYLNTNNTAPVATLIVADDVPPEISNVLIDGSASTTYYLSNKPSTVDLTATVDDSLTGNSNIAGANYTSPTATAWPGTSMYPTGEVPPTWNDEVSEDVNSTIDISGYDPGTYDFHVYAWDDAGNDNITAPHATLTIVDDMAPIVSSATVNEQPILTVFEGTIVTLNATIDDSVTGGSNIAGANFTNGAQNWAGTVMTAMDGAFDSSIEGTTITIDTNGWSGSNELYVYGWDSATPTQNYNTTSTAFATLTVDVIPNTSPTLSWTGETNYLTDGLDPETGDSSTTFTFRVEYTDADNDPPASGGPQLHIKKGGVEMTGSPFTMTFASGSNSTGAIYSYSTTLAVGTDYTYYFTASDNQGASATPTQEIDAPDVVDEDNTPPERPRNLEVLSSQESGTLLLNWDANTEEDLASYGIYRSTTSGGDYEMVDTVGATTTSYVDTGLDNGTTYYYVITAFDTSDNESPYSDEAEGTTKTAVQQVDSWWLIGLLLIIILAVLLVLVMLVAKRKRKGVEEEGTVEAVEEETVEAAGEEATEAVEENTAEVPDEGESEDDSEPSS